MSLLGAWIVSSYHHHVTSRGVAIYEGWVCPEGNGGSGVGVCPGEEVGLGVVQGQGPLPCDLFHDAYDVHTTSPIPVDRMTDTPVKTLPSQNFIGR